MRVLDLMTPDVITLSATASVGDAIAMMSEHSIRHVPLTSDGQVVGIVSDRDIRRVESMLARDVEDSGESKRTLEMPIQALATSQPLSIPATAPVDELVDVMLTEQVGSMLVVDEDDVLVGIVSYMDVLRAARRRFGG